MTLAPDTPHYAILDQLQLRVGEGFAGDAAVQGSDADEGLAVENGDGHFGAQQLKLLAHLGVVERFGAVAPEDAALPEEKAADAGVEGEFEVAEEAGGQADGTGRSIVCKEGRLGLEIAKPLVKLAGMTRGLKDSGLAEGASTRLLIQTGKLIGRGIPVKTACRAAISEALTDDRELLAALDEMVSSLF